MKSNTLFLIVVIIAVIFTILATFIVSPIISWVFLPYIIGGWLIFDSFNRRGERLPRVLTQSAYEIGWGGVLVAIASSYLTQFFTGDFRLAIVVFLIFIVITIVLVSKLNIRKL
jgi:hypothetical protein